MNGRIPAIVLAAGFGRRWQGEGDKLLHRIDGTTVLRRTIGALLAGGLGPVFLVVQKARRTALHRTLEGLSPLCWIENPVAEQGMGTSLAIGAKSISAELAHRGFAVCPGDLPSLRPEEVAATAAHFFAHGGTQPVRPIFEGRPGHPVFFPSSWRTILAGLHGDVGARDLLQRSACEPLLVAHRGVIADLDQRAT